MRIAPLLSEDLTALYKLERVCFSSEFWSEKQLASQLTHSRMLNLGVWENECLLGFVLIGVVLDESELYQVAVSPDRRGQGLAHQLMDAATGILAERGVRKLMLEVRESNQAAIQLYRSFGFIQDGCRKAYYASVDGTAESREDAWLFSFSLP